MNARQRREQIEVWLKVKTMMRHLLSYFGPLRPSCLSPEVGIEIHKQIGHYFEKQLVISNMQVKYNVGAHVIAKKGGTKQVVKHLQKQDKFVEFHAFSRESSATY